MSHFSRIKTKIVFEEFLINALDDLGYSYQTGPSYIDGFERRKKVDVKINLPNSYSIGFKKSGGFFNLTADWWGVRGINKEEFLDKILQRYAYHAVRSQLKKQGFEMVEEETSTQGEVRILMRRIS